MYHIVGTTDGTTANLYVNGVLQTSTRAVSIGGIDGNDLNIGGRLAATTGFWNGCIDELEILDKVLTEIQVKDLYNRTKGGRI